MLLLSTAVEIQVVFIDVSGYDIEPRPHGSSSGYHSDDASPTRKNETAPLQDFRMPGMLDDGRESAALTRQPVQPSDVIIMVMINITAFVLRLGFTSCHSSIN